MVTVVVPVFNRAHVLANTLQSIKDQGPANWECLIVDDGSTDNSMGVAQSFCMQDSRFKLIQRDREPKGAPTCRNIGWQKAENDYVIFLDSDDLLAPWAMEERLTFFKENKDCDFVLSPAMEFCRTNPKHYKYRSMIECSDPLTEFLSFQSVWQTSCPTWKKSALETIKGWDEKAMSWQDGEMHIRTINAGLKFKWRTNIPDTFIRIDLDTEKITNEPTFDKTTNNVLVFQKLLKQLHQKNQQTFEKHIEIWFYRLIELAEKKEAFKIIELAKRNQNDINWNIKKLEKYNTIYQVTKKIPGLRRLFYSLRKRSIFFPRRKAFFVKKDVPKTILKELKTRVWPSQLIRELTFLQNL